MAEALDTGAPSTETVWLEIDGMTCAGCVRSVEETLRAVPGVHEARVNLATESGHVELDQPVGTEQLVAAVAAAGYRATLAAPSRPARPRAARRSSDLRPRLIRLIGGLILTAAVLILAYGFGSESWSDRAQLVLTVWVYLWVGGPFHAGALAGLRRHAVNMDTLVSLGSTIALVYSAAVTIAHPGAVTYYDVAAVIVTSISVGKYLETVTRSRAAAAIEGLAGRQPQIAHRLLRGHSDQPTVDVPIDTLRPGDELLVWPGEALAADGVIIGGTSWLDEAVVTGESTPKFKGPGDPVVSGSVNGLGPLEIHVSRAGPDSTIGRIMSLVDRALSEKSQAQRLADRVSAVFVPAILAASLFTFIGWLVAVGSTAHAIASATAVLVVACPCALGLATPIAVLVGAGRGAQLGLLISGGQALERVHDLATVVIDKTGTLTTGSPSVVEVLPVGAAEKQQSLALAASVELASEHPLARAVVAAASDRGVRELTPAQDVLVTAGQGVAGRVGGSSVAVGSARWFDRSGPDAPRPAWTRLSQDLSEAGFTPVVTTVDDVPVLVMGLEDPVRAGAAGGVASLQSMGIRVVVASGDDADVVRRVGDAVGADEVYGELSPEGKVELLARLRNRFGAVAMVGDGINDAPALAAADMTLVHSDIRAVADALALSRATRRVIWQNLGWACGYNLALIPLAALGILPPMLAAVAMATSSVTVVLNSLRLRRFPRR